MRTILAYKTIALGVDAGSNPIPLEVPGPGEFVTIHSMTAGTVELKMPVSGEWIPVFAGFTYRMAQGDKYDRLTFRAATAGNVKYYFGVGSAQSGAATSISGQSIKGAVDDPNGIFTPDDTNSPAIYYKDQAVPPVVWLWSPTNQNWFNFAS